MAKISKTADAPDDLLRATFGGVELDFSNTASHETDDADVVANARAHPWFDVEEDVVDVDQQVAEVDPNDPHANPSADHLSSSASPEARAAAEANETALREHVRGLQNVAEGENPTVAESLGDTFDIIGTDEEPVLPEGNVTEPQPEVVVPSLRNVPERNVDPVNDEDEIN